jgi:cytochrome c oxidase subunit 3
MSETRRTLDVSHLPRVVFDHRSTLWWGTVGFAVIEGFTLVLMVASYFYLRLGEVSWPPGRTPNPDLFFPTLNLVVLLATMWPLRKVELAARAYERREVARWLLVGVGMSTVSVVLRWYDLESLNVRWDASAYASAAWAIVVLHATLLVADLVETACFAALFRKDHVERKHYSDVTEASFYQYFLSLTWVPLYFIVYWGPRIL